MSSENDYVIILRRAIKMKGATLGRERVAIYKAAQSAMASAFDRAESPVPQRRRTDEFRRLSSAIRQIEAEYRAERAEQEGQSAQATSCSIIAATEPIKLDDDDTNCDAYEPEPFWLEPLPPPPPRPDKMWQESYSAYFKERLDVIRALIEQRLHLASSRDRGHYLWLIVEPSYQVGFVVATYWLLDRIFIMDVYAAPFAVVGVGAWLMFRTTVLKLISHTAGASRAQLSRISRLDELISHANFVGMLYLFVVIAMLAVLAAAGYTFKVNNAPLALAWWFAIWIFAFGIGMFGAAFASKYYWARKAMPLVLRKLMIFSGIVIVTEQLPPDYKVYFLWNPLIHGMQAMRGALFLQYESVDAKPLYFIFAALLWLAIGLAAERAASLVKATA
jgi:capsular polysaccharide transport system permease protein